MIGVDVLAVMDAACCVLATDKKADPKKLLQQARAAVAELIKCCEVTVKSFEALGRTDNVMSQIEAHDACERALIEQKAALARAQGGAA